MLCVSRTIYAPRYHHRERKRSLLPLCTKATPARTLPQRVSEGERGREGERERGREKRARALSHTHTCTDKHTHTPTHTLTCIDTPSVADRDLSARLAHANTLMIIEASSACRNILAKKSVHLEHGKTIILIFWQSNLILQIENGRTQNFLPM